MFLQRQQSIETTHRQASGLYSWPTSLCCCAACTTRSARSERLQCPTTLLPNAVAGTFENGIVTAELLGLNR